MTRTLLTTPIGRCWGLCARVSGVFLPRSKSGQEMILVFWCFENSANLEKRVLYLGRGFDFHSQTILTWDGEIKTFQPEKQPIV